MANKTVTVGPGKTYASLQLAIAGEVVANANLVTMGGILNIVLYSFADTTPASVTGFTTDSTHYVNIYTDATARHLGVWDASKYTLTNTVVGTALTISTSYTRVIGLQIDVAISSDSASSCYGVRLTSSSTDGVVIGSNIIRSTTSSAYSILLTGIRMQGVSSGQTVYNNIIYGFQDSDTSNGQGVDIVSLSVTSNLCVYANTIYGCRVGISTDSNNPIFINNIISSCITTITNSGGALSFCGYNSTDSASWGTGYVGYTGDRLSQTFTFVNSAGFNFLLKTSDTGAYNLGKNQKADPVFPFFIDILGTPRNVPWSIGADQPITSPAFLELLTAS